MILPDTTVKTKPPPKGFKQEPRSSGVFSLWDNG